MSQQVSLQTAFLQAASAIINELDTRYTAADSASRSQLKGELSKAVMSFSEARCKILEDEVACTPEDVLMLQNLRRDVEQAAEIQPLVQVMVRLTGVLIQL